MVGLDDALRLYGSIGSCYVDDGGLGNEAECSLASW